MASVHRAYLGDAVYADVDDCGRLVLTCEDGITAYERIVLEPEVLQALEKYVAILRINVLRQREESHG